MTNSTSNDAAMTDVSGQPLGGSSATPPQQASATTTPRASVTTAASADASGKTGTAAAAAASAEVNPTRVRVKKWNAVAFWAYDIENDTCAICHNQLMVPCITCEAEPHHAEECSVAWGVCSHSYHFHVSLAC